MSDDASAILRRTAFEQASEIYEGLQTVQEKVTNIIALADLQFDTQQTSCVRTAERLLEERRWRLRFLPKDINEAMWDILLELYIGRQKDRPTSTWSLCIASGVAVSTALRYVNSLVDKGYVSRRGDARDRRRTLLELTDSAVEVLESYLRSSPGSK